MNINVQQHSYSSQRTITPLSSRRSNTGRTSTTSTLDTISFYLSHVFHGSIYYYCIKYIITEFILTNARTDNNNNNNNNSIISSLAFYGVYHRTPYNQLIHLMGVPFIIWTMILYGTYLPFTTTTTAKLLAATTTQESSSSSSSLWLPRFWLLPSNHCTTWATLWVLMYVTFYCYIDFIGACLYTPFLYIMYVTSVRWSQYDRLPSPSQKKMKNDSIHNDSNAVVSTTTIPNAYHWYGTGNVLFKAFLLHVFSWYIQIHWGHAILEGATPASLVNLGAALTSAPLFAFYEMIWYFGYRSLLQQQVLEQVAIYTEQLCTAGANLRVCTI